MNKKEEKLFDEEFECGFNEGDVEDWQIKNWIIKHDKRERERLIEEIKESFPFPELYHPDSDYSWRNCEDCVKIKEWYEKIINKYK